MLRFIPLLSCLNFVYLLSSPFATADEGIDFFEQKIRAVLVDH